MNKLKWVVSISMGLLLAVAIAGKVVSAPDTDVLMGNSFSNYTQVLRLNATCAGSCPVTLFHGYASDTRFLRPIDLEPIDVDGDGAADKVLMLFHEWRSNGWGWSNSLVLLKNADGTGATTFYTVDGLVLTDLTTLDIDGNGTTDKVLMAFNSSSGAGVWIKEGVNPSDSIDWFSWYAGWTTVKLEVLEINHAAKQVLIAHKWPSGGGTEVRMQDVRTRGTWEPKPFYGASGKDVTDIKAIDTNGDGTTDNVLMAMNRSGGGAEVLVRIGTTGSDPNWFTWTAPDWFSWYAGWTTVKLEVLKINHADKQVLMVYSLYGSTEIGVRDVRTIGWATTPDSFYGWSGPNTPKDIATLDTNGDGTTDRVIMALYDYVNTQGPVYARNGVTGSDPNWFTWTAPVLLFNYGGGSVERLLAIGTDNCPTVANPTQADCDNDGIGDACDTSMPTPTVTCALVPAGNGGFYTVTFGITNGTLVSAKIDGQAVNNWDLVKLTHSDTNYVKTNRMVGFNGLHINTNGPGTLTVIATNACGTTTCQAFSAQTP